MKTLKKLLKHIYAIGAKSAYQAVIDLNRVEEKDAKSIEHICRFFGFKKTAFSDNVVLWRHPKRYEHWKEQNRAIESCLLVGNRYSDDTIYETITY